MSCLSQLMMTALEDALFARALIFRSDYSLFYVLYSLPKKELTHLTRRHTCQHI